MKCDKYMQMLDKLANQQLTITETGDLNHHLESCDNCRKEYHAIEKYKFISDILKQNKPTFTGKDVFIDALIGKLPDKVSVKPENKSQSFLIPYHVRFVLTSLAASLVLFFAIQQATDAWQIKQLETRFSEKKAAIDYTIVKAGIMIDLFKDQNKSQHPGLLLKIKQKLLNDALKNLNPHFCDIIKSNSSKLWEHGFTAALDSNIHFKNK